jgi:hypothetical protein
MSIWSGRIEEVVSLTSSRPLFIMVAESIVTSDPSPIGMLERLLDGRGLMASMPAVRNGPWSGRMTR